MQDLVVLRCKTWNKGWGIRVGMLESGLWVLNARFSCVLVV